VLPARQLDADGAVSAMIRTGAAVVLLVLLEVGKHFLVRPARRPAFSPRIIVERRAADMDETVDRTGAADELSMGRGKLLSASSGSGSVTWFSHMYLSSKRIFANPSGILDQ